MDPRRSPEWVRLAHLANKQSNFQRQLGSAAEGPGLPTPVGSKAATMQSNNRLRPDDRQRVENLWDQPIQPDEDQPVDVRQERPLGRRAQEDVG